MDWSNEGYVKVYTRETDDDLMLSWQALALWRAMLLKFDRSGLLETRRGTRGLAALVRIPADIVEPALRELLDDGRIEAVPTGFFSPNFMAAQEASKSDRQRQRESRERRAASARENRTRHGNDENVIEETTSSQVVTDGHDSSHDDRSCHESSQVVTLTSADPDPLLPLHCKDIPPARDPAVPAPVPAPVDGRHQARVEIWRELGEARRKVAIELGLSESDQRLMAFDPGERALGMRLAEARNAEELTLVVQQARKAIAVLVAQARANKSVEWLHGAVFESDRSWRRAIGMSLEDAARPRAPPNGRPPTNHRPPETPRKTTLL